jgi:hypothetical protein
MSKILKITENEQEKPFFASKIQKINVWHGAAMIETL